MNILKSAANIFVKPSIVFESIPNFSDNAKPVYDELVSRGYSRKYRMVWYIEQEQVASLKKNGKMVIWNPYERRGVVAKIRNYSFFDKRKANIICNRFLKKVSDEKTFYLKHGSPLKSVKGYYSVPKDIDYIISQSKAFEEISATSNDVDPLKMVSLGFPRNDAFNKPKRDIDRLLLRNEKRVIVWYPTLRHHKNGFKTASTHAIPLLHDDDIARRIDEVAKNNDTLIVIKPHFAQDITAIKQLCLNNILFIDDSFFVKNHISSYEFLNSCDALITDYSSVYYDYTLADKPIGVVWEDIEEYRQFPGFAVDLDYWMKGAEKIYTLQDLQTFITNVAEGKDLLQKERREIRDFANYSCDGKNTERVVDFIIEKAQL